MPNAHSIGKLYWHRIRLDRSSPLHHRYPTTEYEHPFRTAIGHVLRFPGVRLGVVVGKWSGHLDEDEAGYTATQGEPVGELATAPEEVQIRARNYGWLVPDDGS